MQYVNVQFKVYWQFKDYPHLKVTKCKKIIDTKNNKILKYNSRGYFIGGKYYRRNDLNKMIEKIKINDCPF